MHDSKNRTRLIQAMAASPLRTRARIAKRTTPVMKIMMTMRGLMNFIMPTAMNRPIAKHACATARRLAPVA